MLLVCLLVCLSKLDFLSVRQIQKETNIIMESNAKILEGIILIYFFLHTSKKALSSFPPP